MSHVNYNYATNSIACSYEQHYLLMFGGTVSLPLVIAPAMCIGNDEVGKSMIISTAFFVSGLTTLLQTTLGTRFVYSVTIH